MAKIYFVSGKIEDMDITRHELDRMILKMKTSGIRFTQLKNGSYVPLNSNTMELISAEGIEIPIKVVEEVVIDVEVPAPVELEIVEEVKKEIVPESAMDRERTALEMIKAKSDCTHDGDKLTICKIEGRKGTRYFHVCSFCGWRSKFVKADSLSDSDKEKAQTYSEK